MNHSILSGIYYLMQQLLSILSLSIRTISFKFQCLSAFFLQKEFYLMHDLKGTVRPDEISPRGWYYWIDLGKAIPHDKFITFI